MNELQQLRDEIAQLQTALTIKNGVIEQLKARVAEMEAQPAPARQVPEGWQLVPVEPTPAMRVIGARDCSALIQPDQAGEVWRAMLGAVVVPAEYAFAAPIVQTAKRGET